MVKIKDYISRIYNDFKIYIDTNNNLCTLKTLTYQAGKKPDYSDIHIQQFYLLRYAFSYAFEYKSMFMSLFGIKRFKDNISVLSIGCGNMIDYWGLVEALGEFGDDNCHISYTGVDVIDWSYKIEARKGDEVFFKNVNVTSAFRKTDKLTSNVYIFPKSISEFSSEEFEIICEGFREKEIEKNRIYILISLRADGGSMDIDMERSEKLIMAMQKNGFNTKDNARTYTHFKEEERGIKGLDYKFEYPDEALKLLSSLNEKCETYIHNSKNCDDDCEKYLNRFPVMTARNIRYQVLSFDREDST